MIFSIVLQTCVAALSFLSATGTSWYLEWWCFLLKPMLPKKLMWSSDPCMYWSLKVSVYRQLVDEIFQILVGSGDLILCSWTLNFLWFSECNRCKVLKNRRNIGTRRHTYLACLQCIDWIQYVHDMDTRSH